MHLLDPEARNTVQAPLSILALIVLVLFITILGLIAIWNWMEGD
jgi:hypothetical protein